VQAPAAQPVSMSGPGPLLPLSDQGESLFGYRHGRTAIQAIDLAYWVDADEDAVRQALKSLAELRLVRPLYACDMIFYELNREREVLTRLDELFAWQGRWQTQLHRLERMIG